MALEGTCDKETWERAVNSSWRNPVSTTNDAEIKGIEVTKTRYGKKCGVCGEMILLDEWQLRHVTFMLCPECIKAIKWARKQMK